MVMYGWPIAIQEPIGHGLLGQRLQHEVSVEHMNRFRSVWRRKGAQTRVALAREHRVIVVLECQVAISHCEPTPPAVHAVYGNSIASALNALSIPGHIAAVGTLKSREKGPVRTVSHVFTPLLQTPYDY